MKKYIVCIVVALIACVAQVNAVEFKNTYKPTGAVYQSVVLPSISFQSTSSMVGIGSAYSTNPTIGANGAAYVPSSSPAMSSRPRRVKDDNGDGFDDDTGLPIENIDNPIVDPNDPGNVPIGDGLWVLMVLAVGYLIIRAHRRVLKGPRNLEP